jgi:alpha-L-fucosidase 2
MYAARGWVAHHNTDLWRAAAPIDGPLWGLWPCGGAWLCNTLYRHHQFSPDQRFLERLYPLMRGSALFFLDTLIEDPEGRGLITSPSLSPEHEHPFGSSLCAGPAMDRQIIRDLFDHTAAAGRKLGRDPELLAQMAAARARLAPDRVGRSGQLQEWLDDWDDAAPEQQHRHVSHLYGLYPSSQINIRDTPALTEAAKVSLRKRGDFATGWATAWRACLWARLGEGDHALAILKGLLGPKRTYPNMFDAHPPFQIDGNFGGAAAIIEMLLQSWGGELRPLAALPKAWPDGAIKGVRAEGGIVADLEWRGGRLKTLLVRGAPRSVHSIRYDGRLWQATLDSKGFYRLDSEFGR